MNQDFSLQNIKFILIFSGCIFLGISLGAALSFLLTFAMRNAGAWYTSITILANNHLSIYLIPSLAYWYWFELAKWRDFNRRPLNTVSILWIGILAGIVILPFNETVIVWNKSLHLPKIFSGLEQWMRQKEQAKSILAATLTNIKSTDQLIIALIVSGLIASVGEEIFFRGIIQNKLAKGTKNIHTGIWLAATIFSAVHLQFYGFFPRLLLGVLFGYLYIFSGNLWVPIFAHFINNALFVLVNFFEHPIVKYSSEVNFKMIPWLPGGISLIASTLFLIYFYKKNRDFCTKLTND